MKRTFHLTVSVVLLAFSYIPTASANCGLDVCPVLSEVNEENASFQPLMGFRHTVVESNANYTEVTVGGLVRTSDWMQVGINIPVLQTTVSEQQTIGIGNVVPFVTAQLLREKTNFTGNIGLQLETPTATDSMLGDSHFLVLPTIQSGWQPGQSFLLSTIGWGKTLGGQHSHDHSSQDSGHNHHDEYEHTDDHHNDASNQNMVQSFVNPHADSELLWRWDAGHGFSFKQQNIRFGIRTDLIHVLDDTSSDKTIVNIGPTFGVIHPRFKSELFLAAPVLSGERYRMRIGLRVRAPLGSQR